MLPHEVAYQALTVEKHKGKASVIRLQVMSSIKGRPSACIASAVLLAISLTW